MLFTHLRIALASLGANRVRTFLTMLGIIIGVTSISLVMAMGEGAKQAVNRQIGTIGSNVISVRPGKAIRNNQGIITEFNFFAAIGASTLTERDMSTVQKTQGVESAAPLMFITGSVGDGEKKASQATIVATNEANDDVMGLRISSGQFLEPGISRETAVIGNALSVELFGTDNAIGRQITVRGRQFTVIGILKPYDVLASIGNFNVNRAVQVNLDAGKSFNQGIAQIQQINVRVSDQQKLRPVAAELHRNLLNNHDGEEDFAVIRSDEATALTDNFFRVLVTVIAAVASISLIVGGIGIMNIMLVSVTERTREIGIRKAIGATKGQVMSQFVIEAMVMCLGGGIIGVVAAYGLAYFAAIFLAFPPALSPEVFVIALVVSLVVGLLFGLFPAYKAARKNPIEALRQYE